MCLLDKVKNRDGCGRPVRQQILQSAMPISSDSDAWPLARRVLQWQAMTGMAVALVCLMIWGRSAGLSALAGGCIGFVANLYMTLKALVPERAAPGALQRLMIGQLVKVVITVALFVAASRVPHLVWPALLLAYLATLVVFWWVPLKTVPAARI